MTIIRQYFRWHFFVIATEALAFGVSPFIATHLLSLMIRGVEIFLVSLWWPQAVLFTAVMMTCSLSMGLYCPRQRAGFQGIVLRVLIAALGTFAVFYFILRVNTTSSMHVYLLTFSTLLAVVASVITRALILKMGAGGRFKRRVLVYGCGERALTVAQLGLGMNQRGCKIVGFVPTDETRAAELSHQLLPAGEPLISLCRRLCVAEIVLAMDDRRREFPLQALMQCRMCGYEVLDFTTFFEREAGQVRVDFLNPSWMIFGRGFNRSLLRRLTERGFDILASTLLAVLFWPIVVLIAVAIKLEDGWRAPIFYCQSRVGLDGNLFNIMKFRSMRVDAERDGMPRWASQSDPRVTRVGSLLRKLRLDEMPQIFNVLAGDMRFVGPRPERPHFVEELSTRIQFYRERHCVKPGITGWAQLCYPYGASIDDAIEKLQYDLYYIKNQNLLFDLIILFETIEVIILGKGSR